MPATLTSAGLSIQTFDEILAEVQAEFRGRIATDIATELDSFAGQFQRIIATFDQRCQELVQSVYQGLDPRSAEGVPQDRANAGIDRLAAQRAEVVGTFTGTAGTVINDGIRVTVGGFEFSVMNGPYTIEAGGTVSGRVRSTLYQTIDVSALGAWALTDAVVGLDSFDDTSQPIAGRVVESAADYRARAERVRYARAAGMLLAIEAAVLEVPGVTYAKAYHNTDPSSGDPDSRGIPLNAINVVVQGGDDTAVAEAIQAAAPAGTLLYGTSVSQTLGTGTTAEVVSFDRVENVEIWIGATVVTSTSEETPLSLADLTAAIEAALQTHAASRWVIGDDVVPVELVGAIAEAGIPALDSITVLIGTEEMSTSAAKISISVRQQAVFSVDRVNVGES